MQFEPLKDLRRVITAVKAIDTSVFETSVINVERVYKDLLSTLNSLRPALEEVSKSFNAIDQAKDIKELVRYVDHAIDCVHIIEDAKALSPVQAGEALSGLGQIADYADNLIDPDFLKTSIN